MSCVHQPQALIAVGDDLGEFRETVREFAQRSIAPHAAEIDRTNAFPKSENLWTAMGEFGLHGEHIVLCRNIVSTRSWG